MKKEFAEGISESFALKGPPLTHSLTPRHRRPASSLSASHIDSSGESFKNQSTDQKTFLSSLTHQKSLPLLYFHG